MKRIVMILGGVAMASSLTGCLSSGIGNYGAGSDSAYLHGTRGQPGALMTADEEEQYSRQQRVVSQELDLDRKKQRAGREDFHGNLDMVRDARSFINGW